MRMMGVTMYPRWAVAVFAAAACAALLFSQTRHDAAGESVFRKDNLVAWCIVPFDAAKRGPEERAQMLRRLGITRLAYDWRERDILTFDEEIDALERHAIRLEAFWVPLSLEPAADKNMAIVLDLLERRKVRTQIWVSLHGRETKTLEAMPPAERVEVVARAAGWVAQRARRIGCSVALYNHGGWFGEPENQIAVIERLAAGNVGIVYNFHHGHEHVDRFAEMFAKMKPHLLALNLNGMRREGPKILPLGEGDLDLKLLRIVRDSGYQGPIGILDHREELDAEVSLRRNLEGLEKLLRAMGPPAPADPSRRP